MFFLVIKIGCNLSMRITAEDRFEANCGRMARQCTMAHAYQAGLEDNGILLSSAHAHKSLIYWQTVIRCQHMVVVFD